MGQEMILGGKRRKKRSHMKPRKPLKRGKKTKNNKSKSRKKRGGSFLADISVPAGLFLLNQYMKKRNTSQKKSKKSKKK